MHKRIIAMLSAFVFIFTGTIVRCFVISFSTANTVSDSYNSYTIDLSRLNTNIYDCKGELLNNNTKSLVAIIRPNEKCLSELKLLYNSEEIKDITKELSQGYPVAKKINKYADTKYIKVVEVVENNSSAYHLLDKNCGGLEYYVSEELGTLSVNFSVDALGRILTGDGGTIVNNNYDSREGIIISVDRNIQSIARDAAKTISKGAVVVMDTQTSQVLASVSKGDDYVNRALSPYAVGSVFKLVVCASALENNIKPLYKCESSIKVGDTTFHCLKNHSHGVQTIKDALANSCNCYFVNLALKIGGQKLSETAKKLGFGDQFSLYNNWQINSGVFPAEKELSSKGQLALVGFGQGRLTDSPMHFASVVSCLSNGGYYNPPTLDISESADKRVIDNKTSSKLLEYMRFVVTNGSGYASDYKKASAGKTATAQSGIYVNGKEVLITWFAGVYPYNNPKYTIVVVQEDGTSGSENCCPVFRTIVENLD